LLKLAQSKPKILNYFLKSPLSGKQSAMIVAYPQINNTSNLVSYNQIKLTELSLKIDAISITPHITVDKSKTVENTFEYKFVCHSFGTSPRPKRSIILINEEKINLIIKLNIEGPFKLINAEPMNALLAENTFNIIPSSNLKIDIKFLSPSPSNEKEWPMTLVNEKFGKLKVLFENNEFQEFYLKGILKRPRIILNTTGTEEEGSNEIDFGVVNVESTKKAFIYIINETEIETKCNIMHYYYQNKKVYGEKTKTKSEQEDIDKIDDPSVFLFDCHEKYMYGPSNQLAKFPVAPFGNKIYNPLNDKYNPWKVQIHFQPKKDLFYKCRFYIISDTGNKIELVLKGHGSYKEEFL